MGHAISEVVMREKVGRGIESGKEDEELTDSPCGLLWLGWEVVSVWC